MPGALADDGGAAKPHTCTAVRAPEPMCPAVGPHGTRAEARGAVGRARTHAAVEVDDLRPQMAALVPPQERRGA